MSKKNNCKVGEYFNESKGKCLTKEKYLKIGDILDEKKGKCVKKGECDKGEYFLIIN